MDTSGCEDKYSNSMRFGQKGEGYTSEREPLSKMRPTGLLFEGRKKRVNRGEDVGYRTRSQVGRK